MTHLLDTSAALANVFAEPGMNRVDGLINDPSAVVGVSVLTLYETYTTVLHRTRSEGAATEAVGNLRESVSEIVPVTEAVLDLAFDLRRAATARIVLADWPYRRDRRPSRRGPGSPRPALCGPCRLGDPRRRLCRIRIRDEWRSFIPFLGRVKSFWRTEMRSSEDIEQTIVSTRPAMDTTDTETLATGTVRLHRVLAAPPERIYKAVLDPAANSKWLPPHGYTCTVHHLDARVGGTYKMSFTNFSTGTSQSFGGRYLELVPGERIVATDVFDDPNLPGEMRTTYTLTKVSVGTEVNIVQEGIPAAIPAEACYLGWQESLEQLADLVEPEIPEE